MPRIYINYGYRGKVITGEQYWPVGERDVTDEQADYLVNNGHARYLTTSSEEARRNPQLQRFVGQDPSVAVSVDNLFLAIEGKTDSQLIEMGRLNGITIPRTATRDQAIAALMRVVLRADANLMLTPAPKDAVINDLLPRDEADRQFLNPANDNALLSVQERDRLLRHGSEAVSDLEYSGLTTEQKLAYERKRETSNRQGVDFDYDALTRAELIEEGKKRNLPVESNMKKDDLIALLKGDQNVK